MSTAADYAREQGRRPSFTNIESITAEPRGWVRHKPHRRHPNVTKGRKPRTTDGKRHIVTSYKAASPVSRMRPFVEYLTAYHNDLITLDELTELANLYGKLGYKVQA
jgi:hypothetical protein